MRTRDDGRAAAGSFDSADELRAVLSELLNRLAADDALGAKLRAAHWRQAFEFTDLDVRLDVAASEDPEDEALRWTFDGDPDWEPELTMRMDSSVANDYLQGGTSLPVALARGSIRCDCKPSAALRYLPALRNIVEPYRKLIGERYPHLSAAA